VWGAVGRIFFRKLVLAKTSAGGGKLCGGLLLRAKQALQRRQARTRQAKAGEKHFSGFATCLCPLFFPFFVTYFIYPRGVEEAGNKSFPANNKTSPLMSMLAEVTTCLEVIP